MGMKGGGSAWSWRVTSDQCRWQENVDLYIHSPIRLHGVVLTLLSTGTTLFHQRRTSLLIILSSRTHLSCLKIARSPNYALKEQLACLRLCGLVVRVPGYRPTGPGFDSRHYQNFWEVLCLERGLLSLRRINEVLFERKITAPVEETKINNRRDPLRWPRYTLLSAKVGTKIRRPTAMAQSV
jgi:hypothetical protein